MNGSVVICDVFLCVRSQNIFVRSQLNARMNFADKRFVASHSCSAYDDVDGQLRLMQLCFQLSRLVHAFSHFSKQNRRNKLCNRQSRRNVVTKRATSGECMHCLRDLRNEYRVQS